MKFPLNHFLSESTITSSEVESRDKTFELVIDKINLKIKDKNLNYYRVEDLINHFRLKNIEYEDFWNNGENGIRISGFIFFYYNKSQIIFKIVTNPNHFFDFKEYVGRFKEVVPKELRSNIEVNQTDLTIYIFNIKYETILESLYVKKKQSYNRTKFNRLEKRTIEIGNAPAKTVIYDKKHKINKSRNKKIPKSQLPYLEKIKTIADNSNDFVEIEAQLTGNKLPTKALKGFVKSLKDKSFNPFKGHMLANYKFRKPKDLTKRLIPKYYAIKSTIKCVGIFEAKKLLNSKNNFNRDFNKIIIQGEPLDLGDYYHFLLREYLYKNKVIAKNNKMEQGHE